jgi:hypothetical protein
MKEQFSKCSLVNATIFASTVAMTKTGEWFTNREKLSKENPKEYFFIKGNALINKHNLKPGYFDQMKKESLSKLHYEAEILNIRPKGVTEGFYAQLSDKNYYYHKSDYRALEDISKEYRPSCKYDTDLVRNVPIQLNVDFGGRINCCTVSQYLTINNEVRFLKDFAAVTPKKLRDLIIEFIEYYDVHKASCNDIYLYHDRSGYNTQANSTTTLAMDVQIQLEAAGWNVINMTPESNNPDHVLKYRLINALLAEDDYTLPKVRINSDNCPNLIISMENAPVKLNKDGFEKDKASERSTVIKQEHATHLSDTLDYNLYWQFAYLLDYDHLSSYPVFGIG